MMFTVQIPINWLFYPVWNPFFPGSIPSSIEKSHGIIPCLGERPSYVCVTSMFTRFTQLNGYIMIYPSG